APLLFAMVGAWAVWPPPEFFPNGAVMALFEGVLVGAITLLLCRWAIDAVLAPTRPQWRALPVADSGALKLSAQLGLLVALLAIHIAVDHGTAPLSVVDSFTAVWNFLVTIAFAAILLRILDRRLWAFAENARTLPMPGFDDTEANTTARSDLT